MMSCELSEGFGDEEGATRNEETRGNGGMIISRRWKGKVIVWVQHACVN
jgi:hypothetical protein